MDPLTERLAEILDRRLTTSQQVNDYLRACWLYLPPTTAIAVKNQIRGSVAQDALLPPYDRARYRMLIDHVEVLEAVS